MQISMKGPISFNQVIEIIQPSSNVPMSHIKSKSMELKN